jgi:hypothetical protein
VHFIVILERRGGSEFRHGLSPEIKDSVNDWSRNLSATIHQVSYFELDLVGEGGPVQCLFPGLWWHTWLQEGSVLVAWEGCLIEL